MILFLLCYLMLKIGNMTNSVIEGFITEFKKEENQEKIKINIIDPLTNYIIDKVYPYVIISSIIFVMTFVIAILILFLMIKKN